MTYTTKTLRANYMLKAIDIGSNATKLVDDFFSKGIEDSVFNMPTIFWDQWTLTDLDRALDEMSVKQNKTGEVEIKSVDNRHNYKSKLKQWLKPYNPIYDIPSKKIEQEMKMFKHGWRLNDEF